MRKTFFALCLATTSLFNVMTGFAQKGKPLYTFPIGVESYTYRNSFPKSVVATLDTIKALGITDMEAGVPKGLTAGEFKKMCDERGIKISATGSGYEQIVKDPMEAVNSAKALGASYVMVAWIPHQKLIFRSTTQKKLLKTSIGLVKSEG